jgi:hypothetical protein
MIFFGTNSMHIANDVMNSACPHCGSNNTVKVSFYQQYAHVYWIPFFPSGKTGAMQCEKCNHGIGDAYLTKNLASEYNTLLAKQKTPISSFSGLGLVGVLAVSGYLMSVWDSNQDAKSILKPQKGDVYSIKLEEGGYTLLRVLDTPKDSILYQMSEYQADKETAIDQLKSKAYSQDTFVMANSKVKSLYDKGAIIDVE